MEPGKIQPRHIEEGKMAGKDDVPGLDTSPGGNEPVLFHLLYRSVFIDGQILGKMAEKLEGMELGLTCKTHSPGRRYRDGHMVCILRRQAQADGGLNLFLEGLGIAAIHISAAFFQIAGDLLFPDEGFVCLDSLLIGPGVLSGFLRAQGPDQLLVDHSMLGGDLCGGIAALAAGDAPGLHHSHLTPCLLQQKGGENPRHTSADHGGFHFQIPRQGLTLGNGTALRPNGFHLVPHCSQ